MVCLSARRISALIWATAATAAPEVQARREDAIQQIRQAGKAPGILMANEQLAKRYLELGAVRRRRRRYHPAVSPRRRSAGGPVYPHRNHHSPITINPSIGTDNVERNMTTSTLQHNDNKAVEVENRVIKSCSAA